MTTLRAAPGLAGVCDRVAELTDQPDIREFCNFIIVGLDGRALPDYETIDLMKVPRLAPHVFVHDYRAGTEKGMFVKFSGTAIDEHYGKVLQGQYIEEFYTGSDGADRYFPLHRRAIAERRPFFAKRAVLFDRGGPRERIKQSTALYFPCSSDGLAVNYGIGVAVFESVREETEPLYLIL
ncbi:MAG: hypothetical protein COW30_06705 [Rhodospirillales bacterium CG15_BIG_FIL_POST_REV_8_21_14_020_66_15]|nr:MAG: hypothetical protein COW30_06705 [Rhodospirillales bacterium CG15_BIG_FIL_POST_REV_8_21_14_020_66_15]